MTCQSVPFTSIDRWAVIAGDFDAPFAVQGGVCVVTCHLNAQENSLHRTLSWLFPRKKSRFHDSSLRPRSSVPISSKTGFITRKSGFLTITWALYQTATPPLWASNGLLPSTLMYHEFTWRSCVGWYLPAGVTVPHWLSTGSTKPCLNGFKSAMPSYFSLGICSSWLAPSELAKLW